MASLTLQQVKKRFGSVETVRGVDLEIADGEFVVFVGPSGCGKSTLLRMIAGLESISEGQLRIDGQDVTHAPPAQRGVAMVFQSYALYPHMTVYDNMAFGLSLATGDKQAVRERVLKAAEILQLQPLLQRMPKDLSGGQRQRVAIGRAIVRKPKVFLFDEPLSNLDAALRVQMRMELARLHSDLGTTMVYVTHDQVEAMTLADRIVVLNAGRIEQVGAPLDLYHRPASLFVAGFIGSPKMNLLRARLIRQGGQLRLELMDGTSLATAPAQGTVNADQDVRVGIRPEQVELVAAGLGGSKARVSFFEQLGNESFVHLDMGPLHESALVARVPPSMAMGSLPPQDSSSKLPRESFVGPEMVPDPRRSPVFIGHPLVV